MTLTESVEIEQEMLEEQYESARESRLKHDLLEDYGRFCDYYQSEFNELAFAVIALQRIHSEYGHEFDINHIMDII